MSARRLCVLATHLPMHGAVGAAYAHPQALDWGNSTELLKLIAEITHEQLRAFVAVNSRKGARKSEPLKINRPFDYDEPSEANVNTNPTPADIAAFFAGDR